MVKTEYVSMLMVNSAFTRVALLVKNRPKFLAGKVTAVGGKKEKDESFEEAAAREFGEETLVVTTPQDWTLYAILERGDALMHCFYAVSDSVEDCRTNFEEENYEEVFVADIKEVLLAAATITAPGEEQSKEGLLENELSVSDDLAAMIGLVLRARTNKGVTYLHSSPKPGF